MRILLMPLALALASAANAQEVDALYCERGGAEALSVRTEGSALAFEVDLWTDEGHNFYVGGRAVASGPNAWTFREGGCTATITLSEGFLLQFDGCEDHGGARAQPTSLRFATPVARSQPLGGSLPC